MNSLYVVERCRNCPRALIKLEETEKIMHEVFEQADFNRQMAARLQTGRPLHHQIFKAAIAGCPNSCSQPQIKDFGVQGQLVPTLGKGCNSCEACVDACPDQCIQMAGGIPVINCHDCLNCGVCIRACPTGAMQAAEQGYRVTVGGKLGRRPRLATVHLDLANEKQLTESLDQMLGLLLSDGLPGERLGQLLDRMER